MSYCSECGAEFNADASYCPECGTEIQPHPENTDGGTADLSGAYIEEEGETSYKIAIAAAIVGLLPAAMLSWGFVNIGGDLWVFLIAWIGTAWYLRNKRLISEVVGSGFYIWALTTLLTPLLVYIPNMTGEADTASEAGQMIGSVIGLVVWGFVFLIIAIVIAAVGYFANKRASKKLAAS